MLDENEKRSLALLVGKIAAADLKIIRLRTLLVQKGVLEQGELEMDPQEAETFIIKEFSDILLGLGLTSEGKE